MNTLPVDLNCDLGEGMPYDDLLMPFITSANIACGFHAGNTDTMRRTVDLCLEHGVKIGVHPSFRDREHFGRQEQQIPPEKVYTLVIEQLIKLDLIAREKGALLHHVKPHGALYNMAAREVRIARAVAQAVSDFNADLVMYGLSGSHLITEAKALQLATASEVFADRRYDDDGRLVSRKLPGALIEEEARSLDQVRQMVLEGTVTSINGHIIPIVAETICIHGDGKRAPYFAREIHELLQGVSGNGQ